MSDIKIKKTVRVDGKDVTVPVTYNREGPYYVYGAPSYKIEVRHLDQQEAYKRFDEKLRLVVTAAMRRRF
jgi:hypothetical protein